METSQKTLLILKSKPQSLGPVEAFLNSRDWKIKSTCSLKEALLHLIHDKPAVFLVSVDHPNPKAKKLPRVLSQTLPICVVGFTETASIESLNLLPKMGTNYVIKTAVTGPAVERIINKYLKDQSEKENSKTSPRGNWPIAGSKEDTVSIKGNQIQKQIHRFLEQLAESEGLEESLTSTTEDSLDEALSSLKNGAAAWVPASPRRPAKRPSEQYYPSEKLPLQDSLFSKCTKRALERSCSISNTTGIKPIGSINQVSCLLIQSARFSGYLLTALPPGHNHNRSLLTRIKNHLMVVLKEYGETTQDPESIHLKLTPVKFTDWAMNEADFLHTSSHENNQVSVAFFQRLDMKTPFIETDDSAMLGIELNEVEENTVMDFNLYIHLSKNKKYLRYTQKGAELPANQKDRLRSQGLTHFHVLKMEINEFMQYRVQKFLNQKISKFHNTPSVSV
ncbi:hypothetical protein D3C87_253990 [compost metagenome]